MNLTNLKFLLVALLIVIYNYLFWEEKGGINIPVFSGLLIASFLYLHRRRFDTIAIKASLALTVTTGIMIVLHNSFISKFSHFGSFIVLVGFLHRKELTGVTGALFQYILNAFITTFEPLLLLINVNKQLTGNNQFLSKTYSVVRLLLIPLIFFIVFLLIFREANPIFRDLLGKPITVFIQAVEAFLQNLSLGHLLFIAVGGFFILSILFHWERTDTIHEISSKPAIMASPDHLNQPAVTNEFKTALILIASVNVLLLIVNIIDIRFLWLNIGDDLKSAHELSQLVHDGTNLLIFSILLSIIILLYYFRKDLNFQPDNQWLLVAAYTWIIQNGVLVISVVLRNYEYIINYGLTHKRIGVIFFLILTSAGLVLMWLKIKKLYSFFYLFKQASWVLYFAVASLALFDWDSIIARYNLNTQNAESLDYDYLYHLSPRTLPILYENRQKIEASIKGTSFYNHEHMINLLYSKINQYLKEQDKYSWVSWDASSNSARNYFKDKEIELPFPKPVFHPIQNTRLPTEPHNY